MENNLKEIREFISQWKVRAINYYHEAIEQYSKELKEVYNLGYGIEYKRAKQELIKKYNQVVRDLSHGYSPKDREERLQKIIEREAQAKEKTLITRVNKEVGIIEQAIGLYVGVNGELNGMIKGEKGTCRIETIYAGGYNVQCLHYRVLVHKVSA